MQFGHPKRREFVTLLSGAAAWPLAARAQQPKRVGVLIDGVATASVGQTNLSYFVQGKTRGATNALAADSGKNDPMIPVPLPEQVRAKEGIAEIPGTRLGYWDTGGERAAVVLLHPATGSALIWAYQQPVFAKAGYRVIAYSRRGHHNSTPVPTDSPGTAVEDLHNLIGLLGVGKFHVVGSAAGCAIAIDYALSYPERLLSMTLACGTGGVRDPDYLQISEGLRPKGFNDMPPDFRELGPSYRAANPEGVKAWRELEHRAVTGNRFGQKPVNEVTWTKLRQLLVPTLLITGDADLIQPPALMRLFRRNIPNSELVIVPEAGHSVHWERPNVFNSAVLDFIGRHSR
jgi:pimeloyl-ACP methyl ester carboxylesterase